MYVNTICCPENMETAAWGGEKMSLAAGSH